MLGEHFSALIATLRPREHAIAALLADRHTTGVLWAVRNFEPGPEDPEVLDTGPVASGFERVRGQHPLLGFRLDDAILSFARRLGVAIEFDEYGDEYE